MLVINKKNIRGILIPILLFAVSVLVSTCSREKTLSSNQLDSIKASKRDSIRAEVIKDSVLRYKPKKEIHYSILKVKGRSTLSTLDSRYGRRGRDVILAINRIDSKNLRRGDSLVIPDIILPLISYSPYPFVIEEARSVKKMILLSRTIQAFAAYENGVLVRWGPTSTGMKSKQTPEGLFGLNWKKEKTTSTIDSSWILPFYFNFDNFEGAAFHQYTLPGYPASHACARLMEHDAKWIYNWGQQWIVSADGEDVVAYGTAVIVFDDYAFGEIPPWKYLAQNPEAIKITDEQVDDLMDDYLDKILSRQANREKIITERELKLSKKKNDSKKRATG